MHDRTFLDTNVVVYLYSADEQDKRALAEALFRKTDRVWISTQVLSELCNVLRRKFKLTYPEIAAVVDELRVACEVHVVTVETVAKALRLAERYRHSYFDSLILAAALECGCDVLATEDMQDGLLVEASLRVHNPFA